MGHWSAAQSLRQQLLAGHSGMTVEVMDFPAYALPNLSGLLYKFFNLMVSHGRHIFNMYYRATGKGRPDVHPPFEGVFLDRLTELLDQKRPDVVIATHPLCAQLVSRLKEKAGEEQNPLDLPLITCVTDVSTHPEWINCNTDCYLVPSGEVRRSLVSCGVDPSHPATGIGTLSFCGPIRRIRLWEQYTAAPAGTGGTSVYPAPSHPWR